MNDVMFEAAWNRENLRRLADHIDQRTDKPWSFGEMSSCYMAFANDLWANMFNPSWVESQFAISNVLDHSNDQLSFEEKFSFEDKFLTLYLLLTVRPVDKDGNRIEPKDITRLMGSAMLRRLADTDELYFKFE